MYKLVKEFLSILEIKETSDSGVEFYPNRVNSCRSVDLERMDRLLHEMKKLIQEEENKNTQTELGQT